VEKYLKGEMDDFRLYNPEYYTAKSQLELFWRLLASGHNSCYDEETLRKMLEEAGFKDLRKVKAKLSHSPIVERDVIDPYPEISLICEGWKVD